MNPPKMPIHIGDYQRDTGHLRAAEHGAYLLLLFHYWSTGGLPEDDPHLSSIARMSPAEWKRARPTIERFFKPGWKHPRVDFDLEKAAKISEAAKEAGLASGRTRAQRKTNVRSTDAEPTLEPSNHLKKDKIPASAGSSPKSTEYEFEYGVIRLTKKHFSAWEKAYSYLDLRAELIGLAQWASEQSNWFCAVPGLLAKRNREAKKQLDLAKQGGPQLPLTRAGNPWPEGQM